MKKLLELVSVYVSGLIFLFIIGLVIGAAAGVDPNFANIGWYVIRTLVKYVAILVFATVFTGMISESLLRISFRKVVDSLGTRDPGQENLSPVVLLCGVFLAVAQIFALSHAITFPVYFYDVLTKGTLGLFLGGCAAAVMARAAGVTSIDSLVTFYNDHANNQMFIFIVAVFNIAVFVAMMS